MITRTKGHSSGRDGCSKCTHRGQIISELKSNEIFRSMKHRNHHHSISIILKILLIWIWCLLSPWTPCTFSISGLCVKNWPFCFQITKGGTLLALRSTLRLYKILNRFSFLCGNAFHESILLVNLVPSRNCIVGKRRNCDNFFCILLLLSSNHTNTLIL